MGRKKVALYNTSIINIGGVETFCENFILRMYKHCELSLYFGNAVFGRLKKYSDYVDCHLFEGQIIECDTLILASAWGVQPSESTASNVIQVVHADYAAYRTLSNWKYRRNALTTKHVCVGQNVANKFEEVTGFNCDKVIYNLVPKIKVTKNSESTKLRLVTISRISKEKGFDRMLIMADKLHGLNYEWHIYGDTDNDYYGSIISRFEHFKNIVFKGVTDKPIHTISKYDYLVQLSDTEGMPYAVQESLLARTPVISTDYPAIHELVKDGVNGYILNMKLSNFDCDKLLKVPILANYKEKSCEKDWLSII